MGGCEWLEGSFSGKCQWVYWYFYYYNREECYRML